MICQIVYRSANLGCMQTTPMLISYSSADLHSVQSSLNRDLSNIHKWLLSNKLTLNTTKTEFMLIASRQKLSTLSESLGLSIYKVSIKQVSTTESLGILTDDNMEWHSHIDTLSKKIAFGIGAIKQIKTFVSPEILHYIYNALVCNKTVRNKTTSYVEIRNHFSLKTTFKIKSKREKTREFNVEFVGGQRRAPT